LLDPSVVSCACLSATRERMSFRTPTKTKELSHAARHTSLTDRRRGAGSRFRFAGDGVPLSQLRQQTHFHGLAVDPTDRSRLYLATHHGFFLLGADGMATRVSQVQDFMGFTPHPGDSRILYASGHPAAGGNLGFIASTDGGATWTQLSPGANGPVDFHQMDVSPADPNVIYGAYGNIQVSPRRRQQLE
jgi:hypothetical protein